MGQAPDAAGLEFFERKVRPLLIERCLECHGGDAEDPGGGLRLDSREAWQAGGDLGPAIQPGQPEESLLIEAVRQSGNRISMPPDGKLSAGEIRILEQWVAMGAPDPRRSAAPVRPKAEIDLEAGRRFWSFQPLQPPPPPAVSTSEAPWARTTIDLYLAERHREFGLQPVPRASRRHLARRAALDLTGLPPTPEQLEAFLTDDAPDAWERYVDRLLASPAYGERWGRHWLDVARYADSNGLDENIAHGNAWRYRDYVIAAFNQDKPYDVFVQEQLAGDLLRGPVEHSQRQQRLIATGFLSLGPKVLAEVDEQKMELDIIDEQVETTGRAFLALTLGCARCHDHKFDPISTRDYYSLAGVFKSTRTMEHFTKIARWNEVVLATEEEVAAHARQEADLKRLREELKKLEQERAKEKQGQPGRKAQAEAAAQTAAADPARAETPTSAAASAEEELRRQIEELEGRIQELPTAMAVGEYEQPVSLPVHIRGSHLTLGGETQRGVPAVFQGGLLPVPTMPADHSGRLELAQWLTDPRHPLTSRVIVNRVWRWHFGRGLVASTDNFGALGETPTHPALLDWLAVYLVEQDWSLKALHREIMRSAAYRLAVVDDEANRGQDPENRWYWRANPRRLEAEELRDSLLAVSGELDRGLGGSLLHVKNREFLFDHTSKDETRYDAPRRAVYLPVIRNNLYDMFALFDYNDASVMNSNRATTTIAPQALFLMNGDLPQRAAAGLAGRLLAGAGDDAARVRRGYALAFGRPPAEEEVRRDLEFLEAFRRGAAAEDVAAGDDAPSPRRRGWELLCQAWLASNEFIYVH